ncbi:MAG: PaaI family thioesterase [Candidatus Eiseniibacteriota bacterium]
MDGTRLAVSQTPFAEVPINRLLGLELRTSTPDGATVTFAPRAEFGQEYGVIHGGVLSTLADTAAVYALHPFLKPGERMTSIEFKVNFLAPATAAADEVIAESKLAKRGRTIAVVHVDVRQGATLVLTGLFTYIIVSGA